MECRHDSRKNGRTAGLVSESEGNGKNVPTSDGDISWHEPAVARFIDSVMCCHLDDVRDHSIMGYLDRLGCCKGQYTCQKKKRADAMTLGLPVVPLEKLRNASLCLASPGASFLSGKVPSAFKPLATS